MKRTSKNSRSLIEVVAAQQKVIQRLQSYVGQIEKELNGSILAFEKFNDERIKEINAGIRAKVGQKIPHRTAEEIVGSIDVEAELQKKKYWHLRRPNDVL